MAIKSLGIFIFLVFLQSTSISQKRIVGHLAKEVLNTTAFTRWPSLYRFGISNDGKFAYYTTIHNGNFDKEDITIKSLSSPWQRYDAITKGAIKFSDNNKTICFLNSGDSLCVVNLGNNEIQYVTQVRTFNLLKNNISEFLVYQKKSPDNGLFLFDLLNSKEIVIKHVAAYLFNDEGNQIITKADSLINGEHQQLIFRNLIGQSNRNFIYQARMLSNLVLNKKNGELAFIKEENGIKSIWLSKPDSSTVQVMSDTGSSLQKNLQIDKIIKFSSDGSKLFISVKDKLSPRTKSDLIKVNIWSFTDPMVQSRQPNNLAAHSYLTVVDLNGDRVFRLQNENDKYISLGSQNEKFVYSIASLGDEKENYWNKEAKGHAQIVSIENGNSKELEKLFIGAKISPSGGYLTGFDVKLTDFFSYEFGTGKIINLTKKIPSNLPTENIKRNIYDRPDGKSSRGLSFASWLEEDNVLIYDEFDIWKVDLSGKNAPLNITNGFGRKNNIKFRLTGLDQNKLPQRLKPLIITAFDIINKTSGFYEITPGDKVDPHILSMGNYMYKSVINVQNVIKAKDADIYLVTRESATQSSNLYWTKDFKAFNLTSSIFPEKQYNWLTAELKKFKTLDGRIEQGVLYKPEKFDAHKQYPAIIHYYENKSDELNKFHNPGGDGDGGQLDISWFVSHGYIVFTPDIHFKIGKTGQSAYNSVVAAASYLKSLPYISANKIGIQGHSFGGYETNYLVANSKKFAAAISSSGVSNFVTGALSDNILEQYQLELGQNRLAKSLWEDIQMYIKNSPVFSAYNVTTPVMLVHNKIDSNVPFVQGLEWYMALRRLGKRAWMLQYDEGGHGVSGNDYIDYVIRSTQFFDHYLKDSACPRWMLYGIPVKMKGVLDGLELVRNKDENGKWLTPREGGLLTDEEGKKVKALTKRKLITAE